MSGYHAKLSPSSSSCWGVCTASPGAQAGIPNVGSDASRWGSACHLISSTALDAGAQPSEYLNQVVTFSAGGEALVCPGTLLDTDPLIEHVVPIDQEQVECSTTYVKFVRDIVAATGGDLYVEQPLPISQITGEEGATGTGDAVVLVPTQGEIIVIDLKGGMVQVDAYTIVSTDAFTGEQQVDPNSQLAMYAGGALAKFDVLEEFTKVRMIIVQPRLRHVSEHSMTVEDLKKFLAGVSVAAEATRTNPVFVPGEKQCHFCRAKATCGAHQGYVMADMPSLDDMKGAAKVVKLYPVGALYERSGAIVKFLEAVEAHVRAELAADREVIGLKEPLKLIAGNNGARFWKDADAAAQMLRHKFRLKDEEVYHRKVISPADAEKLYEAEVIGKRQWTTLQDSIDQKRNKPSIVPISNKAPALSTVGDMPIDSSDLF